MTFLATAAKTAAKSGAQAGLGGSGGGKKKGPWLLAILLLALPAAVVAVMIVGVVLVGDGSSKQTGVTGEDCAPAGSSTTSVAGYEQEQLGNAAVIVGVGKQMSVPEQGWVVAIAAAMQESGLRNLPGGDRDSAGLFQERPSQGWGTHAQVTDPTYASTQFYNHLLKVPNWQGLSVNDAAQAVERSGFPDAYGPHEQAAREVVGAVSGVTCQRTGPPINGAPTNNAIAHTVINAAETQLGVPYVWGGGTPAGPSGHGGSTTGPQGFDCSGLALYAYAQAHIAVPHQTQAIWAQFAPQITTAADIQPGDLILLSDNHSATGIHHVAIYLGDGNVIEAPDTGGHVQITSGIWTNSYWTSQFIGAVRPGGGSGG